MGSEFLSYEQAAAVVAAWAETPAQSHFRVESLPLGEAAGRVLAAPLLADRDQPPFARSTRDGYACRTAEANAHAWLPVAGLTRAGQAPGGPLPVGAVWEIMTGAPVPAGADAVAMLEHVQLVDGQIRLDPARSLSCGENVVAQGAEARACEQLLTVGIRLGPAQIALAAACGTAQIQVYAKPRVAILATGDELVPVEALPTPGQIRNSNGPMLAALVAASGAEPWLLPIVSDSTEALDSALAETADADLLLISGGVSAGKFDLVEEALARAGARLHFTGVRMQPGKPVVFGELSRVGNAGLEPKIQPFFGLPGNPVSAAVTFLLFDAPVLASLAGCGEASPRFALAQLSGSWEGKPGLTRFLPAFCDFSLATGWRPTVILIPTQGSGDLAAFARSNCFVAVPESVDRLEAGTIVSILLV
jgi:molybdopterin molybdotransferase